MDPIATRFTQGPSILPYRKTKALVISWNDLTWLIWVLYWCFIEVKQFINLSFEMSAIDSLLVDSEVRHCGPKYV